MLALFIPDVYQQSIHTINYSNLHERGIKCLLFDLDNTLTPFNLDEVNEKTIKLINKLKKDFKVYIFSNSPKKRVNKFKEILKIESVHFAKKPLKSSFKKVMFKEDLDESQIAIIGDQLCTDILGGNKVGITTVLVNPISVKDIILTNFNRFLEKIIYKKLYSKGLFTKGKYYE